MKRAAVIIGVAIVVAALAAVGLAGLIARGKPALVSEGKDVTIPRSKTIHGDMMVISADATVAGRVDGSAIVRDGRLLVRPTGRITGNAVAIGGRVRVERGGRVMGRTVSVAHPFFGPRQGGRAQYGRGGRGLGPSPGQVAPPGWMPPPGQFPAPGEIPPMRLRHLPPHLGARGFGPPFAFGPLGIGLLVAPILAGLALGLGILLAERNRAFVQRTSEAITGRTLVAALAGSGVLAILFVIVHAVRAVAGFPLVLALGLCVGVLMLASAMIPAPVVGAFVGRRLKKEYRPAVRTVIGGLLIVAAVLMPFIGPLVLIGASALGLGALALSVQPSSRLGASETEDPIA